MIRILFIIFVFITVSYWAGYFIGYRTSDDIRPVFFISFEKDPEDSKPIFFWGYTKIPNTNDDDSYIKITDKNGTNCYFMISLEKLHEQAEGKKVFCCLNHGKYSKSDNQKYMLQMYDSGQRYYIDFSDL